MPGLFSIRAPVKRGDRRSSKKAAAAPGREKTGNQQTETEYGKSINPAKFHKTGSKKQQRAFLLNHPHYLLPAKLLQVNYLASA